MSQPNPIKMFLPLGLVYGMKYIDTADPTNLMYMRIFFGVGQLLMLGLWLYIYSVIKKSDNDATLELSEADLQPANPLGDMLGADKLMTDEQKKKKPMKVSEYDTNKVSEKIKGVVMQGLIVSGIHYKWGTAAPLIMSVTMALIDVPENPLVKIYLLGKKEADDETLKRPWKAASPFAGMQDAMEKAKKDKEGQTEAIKAEDAEPEDSDSGEEDKKDK